MTLSNNRCAAVRLNLAGREPNGQVQPGPEANTLLDELRAELEALEQPGTRERIVARVVTADEAFGPNHHPDVPDLMVAFRQDLGLLEAAESPRFGSSPPRRATRASPAPATTPSSPGSGPPDQASTPESTFPAATCWTWPRPSWLVSACHFRTISTGLRSCRRSPTPSSCLVVAGHGAGTRPR